MFCKKVLILYVVAAIIFIRVLSFDGTAPNKRKTPQPLVAVTFIIQIIRIVPGSGAVCVICSWLFYSSASSGCWFRYSSRSFLTLLTCGPYMTWMPLPFLTTPFGLVER